MGRMTSGTAHLRAIAGRDRAALVAAGAVAAWLVAALALWLDAWVLTVARAHVVEGAVLYGIPAGAALVALVRRDGRGGELRLAAAAMCTVAAALWVAPRLATASPLTIAAVPALLATALATRRWPAASIGAVFACSAFYGSAEAFLDVPLGQVADVVLGGLWIGLAGSVALGVRREALAISPGTALLGAYVLATLVAVALAADPGLALRAFRLTVWHLLALVVVALVATRRETQRDVARVAAVVALAAGAYATLRWAIGASERELALLGTDPSGTLYNQAVVGEDKVIGSFPNGQELGLWMSLLIPFCMAAALTWKGLYRVIAFAALPLCLIGLLGSAQRTGAIAAAAGCAIVLAAYGMARGIPGVRVAAAGASVLALLATAVVVFPAVVDSREEVERYERILTPERDGPFQERLAKWENALAEVEGEPFGLGVGTAGPEGRGGRFQAKASDNVDSSYVQIAYEQGIGVLVLFLVAEVVLLVELFRHAVWTTARDEASGTIAAAGVLGAIVVALGGNLHLNSLAMTGGWVLVGLGVAQYAVRRRSGRAAAVA